MKKGLKKVLILICVLSIANILPVFAENTTNSNYKIAAAGYTSSGGYKGAAGYTSSGGYKAGSGYSSGGGYNSSSSSNSQNNIQQSDLAVDVQRLQQWLDANPTYADDIQNAIQNSPDPSQALKQWLQNHPEQAMQIKGLF